MFEDKNNGHTCYCENCLKLQAENEELKKEVDRLYEQWNFSVKHKIVLEVDCRKAQEKADKYKQCVDEIEGIVQEACNNSICHKDCDICSDGKILQLIKQAKEGE